MNKALLLRAAAFIDGEAALHRESCQLTQQNRRLDWACSGCDPATCKTKQRYKLLRQTAKDLRKEARAA